MVGEFEEYDVDHAGRASLNVAADSAVALWELRVRYLTHAQFVLTFRREKNIFSV
jgi:hypothetical protein